MKTYQRVLLETSPLLIFTSICIAFMVSAFIDTKERDEHELNVDAWRKRHHIFQCTHTPENVKRRTDWCSTEGWKRESDHSRYGEHNPYLNCLSTAIKAQTNRCEDVASKVEPKPVLE